MIRIYHNPRCKNSRAGLEYLKTKTSDFEIVKYLSDKPFTKETLSKVLEKSDIDIEQLVRKQEKLYKQEYKGKTISQKEWIKVLAEHPRLIERPVVETDNMAVLGNPPENIDKLF
ncbi:MAG: hypothetical protein K9H84_00965 [Bacteroidales bacterium]|nr:hypothetical protein [Bacteroidales bacterium]